MTDPRIGEKERLPAVSGAQCLRTHTRCTYWDTDSSCGTVAVYRETSQSTQTAKRRPNQPVYSSSFSGMGALTLVSTWAPPLIMVAVVYLCTQPLTTHVAVV